MPGSNPWKLAWPVAVWLGLLAVPVPGGLQPHQWQYFAVFAAAIVANVIDAVTVGDGDYAQIAATLRLILSACGEATTKDMDASLCSIAPPIAAFYGVHSVHGAEAGLVRHGVGHDGCPHG